MWRSLLNNSVLGGAEMNKFAKSIKKKMDQCVQRVIWNRERFVNNPKADFIRTRKISMKTLIEFLITTGAGSLNKELLELFKYSLNLPTKSALVQQRKKLKSEALLFLLQEFANSIKAVKKYRGFRLLAIDGSRVPVHRNPNDSDTFMITNQYKTGRNFLHLNALYDIYNKLYLDATIAGCRLANEHIALIELIKRSPLCKKVILIADRGYASYNNIAHLERKGWKYLIRVKKSDSVSGMLTRSKLPANTVFDEIVSIVMTRRQTNEVKSNPLLYRFLPKGSTFDFLPLKSKKSYPMSFRAVCIKIGIDKYEYLITNLDESFTLEDLKFLYQKRWGIETSFRELKHTIAMLHFKSKKVDLIKQEMYAKMVLYNFCEMVTLHVVIKQDNNRKYSYQTNFSVAMTICIKFLRSSKDEHPPNVEALISKYIYPIREGRNFSRDINIQRCKGFLYRVA